VTGVLNNQINLITLNICPNFVEKEKQLYVFYLLDLHIKRALRQWGQECYYI
jgi:hypothetical protein